MKKLYRGLSFMAIILLILGSVPALAQSTRVSGTVKDETGEPVPGVSILEKGTSNGTTTDTEGKYSLNVSGPNAVLVFSFIGYVTQEVPVNNQTTIDLSLGADVQSLQEVVVTGYVSERKQDIVAAVSTLSARNTTAIPISNVEQAMQGRVPGVQVITSGQPGAPNQVRIRGFGSFTSNTPLYIVDGVPTYDVSDINPNDIETTTVLKDAGAASIYGSRASSGVIVYTTKHGKRDGKIAVTYDMSVGMTNPGKGIDILNPQQTADKTWEALKNAGSEVKHPQYGTGATPVLPDYINVGAKDKDGNWAANGGIFEGDPRIQIARDNYNVDFDKGPIVQVVKANKSGTDWYDAMTRVAPITRHSLGLSGGNDRSHFFLGLGYFNQQGIAINQYLKRYTARLNSEFSVIDRVRIGENLQVTYRDNPTIGDPQSENQLNMAYRMNPIIPVHDEYGGWAGTAAPGLNNPANPVASLTRLSKDYNQQNRMSIFGNVYAEVDVLKNLTFRSSFGGTYLSGYAMQYGFRTYENSENNGAYSINEAAFYRADYTFTNTLRYEAKIGTDHSFKALLGTEAIKLGGIGRVLSGSGLNPFSNDPNYISIGNSQAAGRSVSSSPISTPTRLASYFGRLDYALKDKYLLSVTARRDGSSAFGPENRIGYFPAITAGWRISSESFMQGISWLDDLKIRGGWGVMGNQNIPAANQYTLYTSTPSTGYDISGSNGSVSGGIIPQQYGNPSGKWERNITTNVGFDGLFLNGTMDVIVDVWHKKTEDLLFNPPLPATAGNPPNIPYVNVGSMVNKGVDIQIIKRQKITNDLNIIVDGNISFIHNNITKVKDGLEYFSTGTYRNLTFVRNQVGHSLSEFYGYKVVGYFSDANDVASSPTQDGAAPGRFKYADINGDGKIDANDRTFIGSPIPKFTYGLNLTVNYKAFSLEAFFYGKSGNDIVNFTRWFTDFYPSFSGAAIGARTLNSWTPENKNASTPIYENVSNFSTNTQANSYYVEKGSYMRMKNLQISYNLPASLLQRVGMQKARIFVQGVNLFTITKYKGQDPEVASSVDTTLGIDVGNYPATRQYSIGVNLGL
ncbi:SusC/RagA family TonB-linked outer membrane protein [Ohtaekwangia sp.]|uniref:SusC/RagA family TonB-linked outer membrane protein n=1 Tax=Ohtaekwangia sp. TaxID=2066019 RepID=UPI002FDDDB97